MPYESEANVVNRDVVESPELKGKECIGCLRILEYGFFDRDASCRDGRKDICQICLKAPRLSIGEHTSRLKEANLNSEAVKRQRMSYQEELKDDAACIGRGMYTSDFLSIIKKLIPNLYFMDGRIEGDVAVFITSNRPRDDWGGKTFKYLWYVPTPWMPEFSQYEFDKVRDIAIKESQRGWRTPLLRLIESGLLTERVCDEVFGKPSGARSNRWYREIQSFRSNPEAYRS